jgi:cholesterol oxidase
MMRYGRASYLKFQRVLEPPEASAALGSGQPGEPRLWFTRSPGGLPFFFTDTRTERMSRDLLRMSEGRIMREPQLRALLDWLSKNRKCGSPVFVVSPSILLPRRRSSVCSDAAAIRSDAWDGYLHSFRTVLAHIANDGVRNVVFLSGDEHHSCVAQIALTPISADGIAGPTTQILSIHSSALYAPFPFANGQPEDLAGDEEFTFADLAPGSNRTIRCRVRTCFLGPVIGGFATVECTNKSNGVWNLTCAFDLDDRKPTPLSFDIETGQV